MGAVRVRAEGPWGPFRLRGGEVERRISILSAYGASAGRSGPVGLGPRVAVARWGCRPAEAGRGSEGGSVLVRREAAGCAGNYFMGAGSGGGAEWGRGWWGHVDGTHCARRTLATGRSSAANTNSACARGRGSRLTSV